MPSKKKPPARTAAPDPEFDLIRRLADILNETGLSEIELDRRGVKVRVARGTTHSAVVAQPVLTHQTPAPQSATAALAKAADADHPGTIKSPMVGTVYRSSAPGVAPFVDVGAEVKEGQVLLIIEAMKTMNQIPAPRAGRVTHVFVDSGHPVEYGEPLVVIE
ncbi:MAG: acetyl-CoA carboxylase biotin carboxyl carrier protein [Rhizobiales bacterium]|nr:acetyl-CoA carboxylase biotin carboxyl carrier protein [Hyphomicrobiales bacterium]